MAPGTNVAGKVGNRYSPNRVERSGLRLRQPTIGNMHAPVLRCCLVGRRGCSPLYLTVFGLFIAYFSGNTEYRV